MKMLHILEPIETGGVEKFVALISEEHRKKNQDVHIALPSPIAINYLKVAHDRTHIHLLNVNNFKDFIKGAYEILKTVKKIRPDVIITHTRRTMLNACLLPLNVPIVRVYHMEEKHRIPVTPIERYLIQKKVSLWILTWEGLKYRDLKSMGISENKICIIPNGVKDLGFKKKTRCIERVRLLFVGRLTSQKGLDIFIEALSKLTPKEKKYITLTVVGEGPEKENYIYMTRKYGLNTLIKFEGFKEDVKQYLYDADILIMPSRYEGLPLVMIEAFSTGTPVAGAAVGAHSVYIKNNYNGWIIEPNSAEVWCIFISRIIKEGLNSTLFENARYTYEKYFDISCVSQRYLDILKFVVK